MSIRPFFNGQGFEQKKTIRSMSIALERAFEEVGLRPVSSRWRVATCHCYAASALGYIALGWRPNGQPMLRQLSGDTAYLFQPTTSLL